MNNEQLSTLAVTYCPTAVSKPFTAHSTLAENYSFSAKERDTETGLSYFGSRYYSGDLSIWLSVDPMSDKYPSLSPYVYCANNPVKLVDPNGEWIPGLDGENNIIVTREEGDNEESFRKFMGTAYSDEDIQNMYGQMQDGKINLTKTYGNEFQIMTDAINDAFSDSNFENNENYNCWGAAIAVSKKIKLQGNGLNDCGGVSYYLNEMENFDNTLSNGYVSSDQQGASVGKTVLRFGTCNENGHGAVYLGKSQDGTEYVFTKNGWKSRPTIMTTERMLFENPKYGSNQNRSGVLGQGYYTQKVRRHK